MQSIPAHKQQIPHNLPSIHTSFIGCEPAIATIRELLSQTRLLTLTGSGGSGKTRLALSVAESVAASLTDSGAEDGSSGDIDGVALEGVAWVDLAPLADPGLVPQTVADALHLREQPQRSYTELITDFLCDRRLLLVLDNCEHLRAACADLIGRVLQAGAVARVLVTSREPLGVEGERVWLVPMLSLPPSNGSHAASPMRLQELLQSEAVRLFDERARAVAPSFTLSAQNAEVVAQICQRLDGLPLAIELAAARANILMPTQIVERLDNSVHLLTRSAQAGAYSSQSRHQTLRAALDWSFDLLPAKEQDFFSRLSIFAGNFGVEAIEGICAGAGLSAEELLDLLANLVEKSLVIAREQGTAQYQEMRYRLLVPVRHYAAERLRAAGEESHWRGRHAAWYLDLAKRAGPELERGEQSYWLDRLESEHDNLRAALAWYAAAPDGVESGLQLSCAIGLFWAIRSYLSEGQRWLERFMSQIDPGAAETFQVNAINLLARMSVLQSNFQAARAHYERSIAIGSNIEYDDGVETGLIGLGIVLWELGEFQKARSTLDEAVRYARSAGHLRSLARALNNLGLVCMHQGDRDATRAYLQEGLAINQQLGHKTGIATVLFNLAMLASHDGDPTRARLIYGESLAISRELGNRTAVADTLNNLGAVAVAQGDLSAAATHFEEAAHLYREAGAIGDTAYTSTGMGDIAFYSASSGASNSGDYGAARGWYTGALALFREASNQRLISRVLGQLGRIACREGDVKAAAELCGEALSIRRTIGHKPGMIFILDQGYVEIALATAQPAIAARILGAIAAARKAIQRPREPIETRQLEPHLARLQDQLGEAEMRAAWAEGEAMSLDEVTAYALDTLSAATVEQARPALRIFGLGHARVYRGDHLLTSADWTYGKARELFFYLLIHPNSTREQIGLDFWPDASAEQVRKRFSAAVAHARNALGRENEWITLSEGRYRIDPTHIDRTRIESGHAYWFDVELFEEKLHAAGQLLQNGGSRQQTVALLEEAIKLYQGDFAEEFVEGEWHRSRRASLSRAFLDALLTLGGLYFEGERTAQAIAVYQRALAKDPYLEEAHYELMRCYARIHKRSQALRQYETLCTALAELNATPSSETQLLIEHLRLGEQL